MEVVAEMLTTDALQARPGSRVIIERWGGAEALQGRVRLVEPAGFTKVSALGVEEQRVRVLIDIASPPDRWRALGDGYRVGVRIVTQDQADVVKVPVSALFPRIDAPGMAVFVIDGDRARLQPVDVAARNGSDAWVRQGLQPGATVIVYPAVAMRDGMQVRARKM
jgi:HlyD family secretion protein